MKDFDEVILDKDFDKIIFDEPDFNILLDLKRFLEDKIANFLNDFEMSDREFTEAEKISLKYCKDTQSEIQTLKRNLKNLDERIQFLNSLRETDVKLFLEKLTEEKLSRLSVNDLTIIATKLDKDSFFNLIDKIEMFKLPHVFKKDCPEFINKNLEALSKIREKRFPVSKEVKDALDSGLFDPKPSHSGNSGR